jgi:RNA polymerase sigma-70 factor, ECF subfamily
MLKRSSSRQKIAKKDRAKASGKASLARKLMSHMALRRRRGGNIMGPGTQRVRGGGLATDECRQSVDEVMSGLAAGQSLAAEEVFARFAHRLVALARVRLSGVIRQKEDPDDIVQSVFKSFFARHQQESWTLNSWESVWALLSVITLRKCGHRLAYYGRAGRDVRNEVVFAGEARPAWEAVASGPTPEQAYILTETLEALMRDLEQHEREMLTLTLQGDTVAEISRSVGCSQRTVQRCLQRVRDRLKELLDRSAD